MSNPPADCAHPDTAAADMDRIADTSDIIVQCMAALPTEEIDLLDESGRVVGQARIDGELVTARITDPSLADQIGADAAPPYSIGYRLVLVANPAARQRIPVLDNSGRVVGYREALEELAIEDGTTHDGER